MVKLLDVSKNVISKYSKERIFEEVSDWAKRYDEELAKLLENKEYSLKIFGIERGNNKPRKDIAKWSDVKNSIIYMYDDVFFNDNISYDYAKISVEMGYAGEVKEFKANPGMYKAHVGDVSTVLRVALTARTNTPDMYEIMQVLGKESVINRLEKAVK